MLAFRLCAIFFRIQLIKKKSKCNRMYPLLKLIAKMFCSKILYILNFLSVDNRDASQLVNKNRSCALSMELISMC